MLNGSTGFASNYTPIYNYQNCDPVGDPADCASRSDPLSEPWNSYLADINGDGKVELLFWDPTVGNPSQTQPGTRMRAFMSTTSGVTVTSLLSTDKTSGSRRYQFADVNGDGLPDAIELSNAGGFYIYVWKNTGRGFLPRVAMIPSQVTDWMGQSVDLQDNSVGKPRDPGLRIVDFNGDGRADLLQLGNNCLGDGSGLPAGGQRTNVTVMTANASGALFANGFSATFGTSGSSIPVGDQSYDSDNPNSGCGGGYLTSQVLDVNGDGLTDIVQVENGEMVVYIRQGQQPGLLNGITDGLGNTTQVSYLPITDPSVHTPVSAGGCLYPQYCNIRGKWLVSSHTLASSSAAPLTFNHNYGGARADVTGTGWLGMDSHTATDTTKNAAVTTRYDHQSTYGSYFYPLKDLPYKREENYPLGGDRTLWRTTTTDCSVVVQNDGARAGLQSCSEDQLEWESDSSTNPKPTGTNRRSRVQSTYDLAHGYVTERDTSIGTTDDFYDTSNEVTKLTRSTFTSDNEQIWLVGMAQNETINSSVPGGSNVTRTKKYSYDTAKGVVTNMWLEPNSTDQSLYQETRYQRNTAGQVTQTSVFDLNNNWRYTAVDYNATGDVFPASVRVGGFSTVAGAMTPEQKTTRTYDLGTGLLLQTVDPNGIADTRQYDTFGRLRMEQRSDGSILSRAYNGTLDASSGTLSESDILTSDRQKQKWDFYDQRGQVTSEKQTDDGGSWYIATQISYENHGWVSQRTRPVGSDGIAHFATYFYDSLGRPIQQTGPIGYKKWDYVMNTTTRTIEGSSSVNQVDTTEVDQAGRVITRGESVGAMPTSPTGGSGGTSHVVTTTYNYGPFGTLADVFDTQQNNIHANYDIRGRRTMLIDPDAGTRQITYDTYNEIVGSTVVGGAENGQSQAYAYDVLGRKVSETTSEGTSTFTWDAAANAIGKLASSTSQPDDVTVGYEYDQQGRVSAETRGIGGLSYRLDFGYDDEGRAASVFYPQQNGIRYSASYGYSTNSGELMSVTDGNGGPLWHADSRNLDKRILQETYGDNSVALYGYEPERGFLTSESVSKTLGGASLMSETLSYDVRGYLSQRTSYLTGETETFTHDELGRLTHWNGTSGGNWSVHYDYDDIGNIYKRTQSNTDGSVRTDTYTSGPSSSTGYLGGPHAATKDEYSVSGGTLDGEAGEHDYNYDGLGRQKQADTRTFVFTDSDLPRIIQDSDTTWWTYKYDANHARASKLDSKNNSTVYVGRLYEKRTDTSGTVTHVMYVNGERGTVIAQVTQPDGGSTPTVDYPRVDQLGSITDVTSSDNTSSEMRFDPFGARISTNPGPVSVANPLSRMTLGFTGQENEDDLGLINLNGRIYNPSLMRFITPDPMVSRPNNSQEFNRYSYANNSPFRFVDTTGFQDFDFDFNFDFNFDYNFSGAGDLSGGGGFTSATGMSGYGGACYGGTTGVSGADGLSGGFGNGGNVFVGAPVDDGLPSAPTTPFINTTGFGAGQVDTSWMSTPWLDQNVWGPMAGLADYMVGHPDERVTTIDGQPVYYGTFVVPGLSAGVDLGAIGSETSEIPQILQNAANGRAFEQAGLDYVQTINTDVAEQVSIRPFTETGELANFRVRLDAVGLDDTGSIVQYDFKGSATAGFTPRQQVGYPLLEQNGGMVVGNNGGLVYPAGTIIPPTPVTILRPGSF